MRRGNLEIYFSLLFGYNGVTARTRVLDIFCNLSWHQDLKFTPFLVEHGFLEKILHRGTRHTFRRTEKGEKFVNYLLEGDMYFFLDKSLLEIYRKSEEDRKPASQRKRVQKSVDAQKRSVLELLMGGERYVISRIVSYSLAIPNNISQVIEELEKEELITLYPTKDTRSKGKYGITSKGMTLIMASRLS